MYKASAEKLSHKYYKQFYIDNVNFNNNNIIIETYRSKIYKFSEQSFL